MSREHCTVVFADVSGSTRLFEGCGDEAARSIIQHVLYGCSRVVAQYEGQVVKTIGDEVMASFPDADIAVLAAIGMQRWAHEDREMCEQALGLRVGLHHGQVIAEDSDIFGSTVNTAARMVALAAAGQIVMSRSTAEAIGSSLQECWRHLGAVHIAGREEALDVVSVVWEQDRSNLTAVPTGVTQSELSVPRQLVLVHAAGQLTLSEHSPPMTLGRGSDCSLVVEGDCVSRHHARIEFRHGFYMLVDQSTNGTWLAVEGQLPALVHRGELPLLRDGCISLGRRQSPNGVSTLCYRLEDAQTSRVAR